MFQTSEPLIRVSYDEMSTLILQLMRRCLTPEAIGDRSGKELYEVDLDKNWLTEVNIGVAAKAELKKLKDAKEISDASYSTYQKGISKLQKMFPLKNSLLHY